MDGADYARAKGVKVGRDCRILIRHFGTEPFLIEIGDRVTISGGTVLLTHDGATWLIRDEKGRRFRYARIRIGSDVLVGANSIILPGIEIGDRVIVGAGSVITRSVPSGSVVAGAPARIISTFETYATQSRPAAADMTGMTFQEKVVSITEPGFRPMMDVTNLRNGGKASALRVQ